MKAADAALLVGVMVFWGLNFVVGKWAVMELPPIFAMACRFALVAAILLPFVKLPRAHLGRIALLALTLGCVHFSLFFSGMRGLDAGLGSIVAQSQVPFATLIGAVVFKDWPGWRRWAGMALAFFGVWLAAGEPGADGEFVYIALCLAGSFMWAIANYQVKALGAVDNFALNAYRALFAVPLLLGVTATLESGHLEAIAAASVYAWAGVLYMAVVISVCTYWVWYRLIRRYPVNQVVPYSLLVPVFGVIFGVLLEGDPFGWRTLAGCAATVAGVAIITLRRPGTVDPETGSKSA